MTNCAAFNARSNALPASLSCLKSDDKSALEAPIQLPTASTDLRQVKLSKPLSVLEFPALSRAFPSVSNQVIAHIGVHLIDAKAGDGAAGGIGFGLDCEHG